MAKRSWNKTAGNIFQFNIPSVHHMKQKFVPQVGRPDNYGNYLR